MATTQLELWDPPSRPRRAPQHPRLSSGEGATPPLAPRPSSLIDSLRDRVSRIESGGREQDGEHFSCGASVLDRMLPGGGLAPGTINEWIASSAGWGAGWLSLLAARSALAARAPGSSHGAGGRLVVIDAEGSFYPPAAIAAGIPAERMILVRPADRADLLWAADQALRSPAVAAVWGALDEIDDRHARRLQLAAEAGDSVGLWIRPGRALSEPSWAEVRWHVRAMPAHASERLPVRRLEARLVRCRGGRAGRSVVLEIDSAGQLHPKTGDPHAYHATSTAAVPLAAQLAHPAAAQLDRRRRRA